MLPEKNPGEKLSSYCILPGGDQLGFRWGGMGCGEGVSPPHWVMGLGSGQCPLLIKIFIS